MCLLTRGALSIGRLRWHQLGVPYSLVFQDEMLIIQNLRSEPLLSFNPNSVRRLDEVDHHKFIWVTAVGRTCEAKLDSCACRVSLYGLLRFGGAKCVNCEDIPVYVSCHS